MAGRRRPHVVHMMVLTVVGLCIMPWQRFMTAFGASQSKDAQSDAAAEDASGGEAVAAEVLPSAYASAIRQAWRDIDALEAQVNRRGLLSDFGRQADKVVKRASNKVGRDAPSGRLVEVIDAPLRALFQRQLQTLRTRLMDSYEADVDVRPNPLEAAWKAEKEFVRKAQSLVRPGSDWQFEAELEDLKQWLDDSYKRDMELVETLGKQGQGKQITIEVIRALQGQAAGVMRTAENHGAFPWDVKWQWLDTMRSRVGFRGQYQRGRSVVEMLILPSNLPKSKRVKWWQKLGSANLAVAFDMLV